MKEVKKREHFSGGEDVKIYMPVRQSIRLSQILVLELLLDFLERTRPNGCLNQHHSVRQTPAGFAMWPTSWDRCLVWSPGKESKRQKQFIRSKMARFGVDSLANVIAIYFKLVGKWPQLDTVMTRSYACLNSVNGDSLIWRTLNSRRFWWVYLAHLGGLRLATAVGRCKMRTHL